MISRVGGRGWFGCRLGVVGGRGWFARPRPTVGTGCPRHDGGGTGALVNSDVSASDRFGSLGFARDDSERAREDVVGWVPGRSPASRLSWLRVCLAVWRVWWKGVARLSPGSPIGVGEDGCGGGAVLHPCPVGTGCPRHDGGGTGALVNSDVGASARFRSLGFARENSEGLGKTWSDGYRIGVRDLPLHQFGTLCQGLDQGLAVELDDVAALHDGGGVDQFADVGRRVSPEGRQVGDFAGLDAAHLVPDE